MLEVIGGAAVSAVMITGGVGLVANEFRKRWPQVITAFERPQARLAYDVRPIQAITRRHPRQAPAFQPAPARRLAA